MQWEQLIYKVPHKWVEGESRSEGHWPLRDAGLPFRKLLLVVGSRFSRVWGPSQKLQVDLVCAQGHSGAWALDPFWYNLGNRKPGEMVRDFVLACSGDIDTLVIQVFFALSSSSGGVRVVVHAKVFARYPPQFRPWRR